MKNITNILNLESSEPGLVIDPSSRGREVTESSLPGVGWRLLGQVHRGIHGCCFWHDTSSVDIDKCTHFSASLTGQINISGIKIQDSFNSRDIIFMFTSNICRPLDKIVIMANLSFANGVFPARFKLGHVIPLIKKAGSDVQDPSNYRPITNLVTISKILERLVLVRIRPHVHMSKQFSSFQSGIQTKALHRDCSAQSRQWSEL